MGSNLPSCAREGEPRQAASSLCPAFLPHSGSLLTPCARVLRWGRKRKAAYWCPEDAQRRVSVQAPNPAKVSHSTASACLPPPAPVLETPLPLPAPPPRHLSHPCIPPSASVKTALPGPTASCGQVTFTRHLECPLTGTTAACILGFQVGGTLPKHRVQAPFCYLSGSCLGV